MKHGIFITVTVWNLRVVGNNSFFQYVVTPTRRSSAEAFQILISHMFGDAGSPYLIGVVSAGKYYHLPVCDFVLTRDWSFPFLFNTRFSIHQKNRLTICECIVAAFTIVKIVGKHIFKSKKIPTYDYVIFFGKFVYNIIIHIIS